jgi:hypothetical protein
LFLFFLIFFLYVFVFVVLKKTLIMSLFVVCRFYFSSILFLLHLQEIKCPLHSMVGKV